MVRFNCRPPAWGRRAAARVFVAALALAGPAAAAAAEPWVEPELSNLRYDEDWSGLADPGNRTGDWPERFRYAPVGAAGDAWVGTGLELRLRSESFEDALWGQAEAADDGYVWLRAMPHLDLHVGRGRAFVQPIVAYAKGVAAGEGPLDETGVDLLQGFAEVTLPVGDAAELRLRAGRQMMALGAERLVSMRYGPNVPRAFEGVRADLLAGPVEVSAFWTAPVQPGPGAFDDRRSRRETLEGAYVAGPGLDLYYLRYRDREAAFLSAAGDEVRHTLGVRAYGAGSVRWEVEGMAQSGDIAGQSIRAWALAADVRKAFPDVALAPMLRLRAMAASGDRDADDGRLGTFNALFPKGKAFGELSPVGPYNVLQINPQATVTLRPDLSLTLVGMTYRRLARADGVYDISGVVVRARTGERSLAIGQLAELIIDWQATRTVTVSASASIFAPGRFIRRTGSSETIGMIGFETQFRF